MAVLYVSWYIQYYVRGQTVPHMSLALHRLEEVRFLSKRNGLVIDKTDAGARTHPDGAIGPGNSAMT